MYYTNLLLRVLPISSIIQFPFDLLDTVEYNFLECDGSQLLKTSYSKLYNVIGTEYGETDGFGGVGTTHFTIPDYRGVFLRHTPGDNPVGFYDDDHIKEHEHYISNSANDDWDYLTKLYSIKQHSNRDGMSWSDGSTGDGFDFRTGSSYEGGNETRPINIYVVYCIRYR